MASMAASAGISVFVASTAAALLALAALASDTVFAVGVSSGPGFGLAGLGLGSGLGRRLGRLGMAGPRLWRWLWRRAT